MSSKPKPRLVRDEADDQDDTGQLCWQSASTLKSEKVDWILRGRLPAGHLCLIDGAKGTGKSTLCAALAAHITAGVKIPSSRKSPPAGVLWLTSEESYEIAVRPRLVAAGADLSRVHVPPTGQSGERLHFSFPSRGKAIQDAIAAHGVRLVVLDPFSSHIDSGTDLNTESNIRPILEGIARLAAATGCLFIGIRHLKKDRSCSRLDQGLGSVAISGVARSVLAIDQPDLLSEKRILRVLAMNIGRKAGPLEYEIVEEGDSVRVAKWKEIPREQEDAIGDQLEAGDRDTRQDARDLLQRVIVREWISTNSILAEADSAGISPRTLRSAKAELGIRSRRVGSVTPAFWEWGPPK